MKNLNRFGLLAAALLLSLASHAADNAAGNGKDIEVSAAWVRATAPGQDTAGVDMTITSKHAARLVGVSSPVAKSAELHSMMNMAGMMEMREVDAVDLPSGKPVNLGASGYHVMLNQLKAPLKEGDSVPLILSIMVGENEMVKIRTTAEVRSLHTSGGHTQGGGPDLNY